ncbi:MAG: zinc ribbon domain-containing protein [Pelotomaculum sp.]|nr:zinc ribbon domain-containing protein [Pelotomaculum sp.]
MPVYEFRCAGCGRRFEKLCPMGESGENLKCPECGAPSPRRVMSSFSAAGAGGGKGGGSCSACSSRNCGSCGL